MVLGDTPSWAALTEAELRVARLIAEGHTNKSAAAQLGVSPNTIGAHLRTVFGKLGVRSRVQLTNFMNRSDTGWSSRGTGSAGQGFHDEPGDANRLGDER